jgi:hypothetical protein
MSLIHLLIYFVNSGKGTVQQKLTVCEGDAVGFFGKVCRSNKLNKFAVIIFIRHYFEFNLLGFIYQNFS